ncbi:MAG: DUF4340 domain-containing protein [Deltaproteobacteria bacterium]|nr:DUF4340 domain-containing protein [Deltaproteobacteria bacterium]
MSKLNKVLVAALLAQVAIFVVIKLWPAPLPLAKPKAVLSFDQKKVTKIQIVDGSKAEGKKETLTLTKAEGKWVVQGSEFPVEGKKASELLGKLVGVKAGASVTDRPMHQRKLEVAKDHYQRRVTLTRMGEKDLVFFLGSSPGLKKVHLRIEGQKAVYAAAPLVTWDIGAAASSWVKTAYFKPDRDRIVGFTLKNNNGTIHVIKREGQWKLAEGDVALKQAEVNALISTMTYVSLLDPVGKKVEPSYGLTSPQAMLTVELQKKTKASSAKSPTTQASASQPTTAPTTAPATEMLRLRLGAKKGTAYYAKRDASPFVVTIDSSTANALVNKKLSDLVEKKKEEKKTEGEAAGVGVKKMK